MSFEIREVEEVYQVRGKNVTVKAPAKFDTETNQQVFDEKLDDSAITRAFDIYRRQNQMITIPRIKHLRHQLGLSQRDFAALMSWSPTTVATYETGALPSAANNSRLLELEDNPMIAIDLLKRTSRSLTVKGERALQQQLQQHENSDARHKLASGVNLLFKALNDTEYAGYTTFDLKKFSDMVLFFVNRVSKLSATKLNKLMFYTDFKYFGLNTVSMSGVPYACLDYGPVPDNYKLLYGVIEEAGLIQTEETGAEAYVWEYYRPMKKVEDTAFSADELAVLNDTLSRFATFSANQLSQQSHTEQGWLKNTHGQNISYEFAEQLSTLAN